MTQASFQIHENSVRSYHELKRAKRYEDILSVFRWWGKPLTDRKVKELMHFDDMNKVRPRISELIDMQKLKECGNIRDDETKKTVRLVRLIRPEEQTQGELF